MSKLTALLDDVGAATHTDVHVIVDRRIATADSNRTIQCALSLILSRAHAAHNRRPTAVRWRVGGASLQSAFDVNAWYKFCDSAAMSARASSSSVAPVGGDWSAMVAEVANVLQSLSNDALVRDDHGGGGGGGGGGADDAVKDSAMRRSLLVLFAPLPADIECSDGVDVLRDDLDEPFSALKLTSLCDAANARLLFVRCGRVSDAVLCDAVTAAVRRHLRGECVHVDEVATQFGIATPALWPLQMAAMRLRVVGWSETNKLLASMQTEAHCTMGAQFGGVLSDEWAAVAAISIERVLALLQHCSQFACVKSSVPNSGTASFSALVNSLLVTNTCLLLAASSERAKCRHLLLAAASGGVQAVAFVVPADAASRLISHQGVLRRMQELSDGVLASLRRLPSSSESRNAVLVVKKLTRAEESLFAPNRAAVLLPTVEIAPERENDDEGVGGTPSSPIVGSPDARRRSIPRAVRSVAVGAGSVDRFVTLYIGTLCGKSTDMRNDVCSILEGIADDCNDGEWTDVLRRTLLRDAAALRLAHERSCSVLASNEALNSRQCIREVHLQCTLRLERASADPLPRATFDELCQLLSIYCFRLDSESPDGYGFRVWLGGVVAPYLGTLPRTMRAVYSHFELEPPDEIRKVSLPYDMEQASGGGGGGNSPKAPPAARPLADVIRHMSLGKNQRKREAERNNSTEGAKKVARKRSNIVLVAMPTSNER